MIQLPPKFGILDFFAAIIEKLENWRARQMSRMEFSQIDLHTMQDVGFGYANSVFETTERMSEK